ncbi:MAG: endoproteinase ArgC [Ottowia sp.]|nr:endoproteinase ArgC [Ottowia sp.]
MNTMNPSLSFKRRALWSAAALALCGTLASCGGGDDGGSAGGGGGGTGSKAGEDPIAVNTSLAIAPMVAKSTVKAQEVAAQPVLGADAPVAQITLPALAATKAALPAPQKGQAMRIGTVRATGAQAGADEVAKLLQWQLLPGGGQAAALRFASTGAAGVRLAVDVQSLPEGAVLRFYGDEGEVQAVPAAEAARLRAINEKAGLEGEAARTVWSLPFDGERATLEVELPAGVAPDAVALAVPQLSHQMLTVQQALEKDASDIGSSGSCNLNATCVYDDINAESRAVAKMIFNAIDPDDGRLKSYLCTGTLLNDANSSGTPYFITANHCISTQGAAASLTTYWFFRAASCGSPNRADGGMKVLGGGAEGLITSPAYDDTDPANPYYGYDATLLKLNNPPPAGAVYAGSYWGSLGTGDGTLGVHHPGGDLQKYSVGNVTGYTACKSSSDGGSGCARNGDSTYPLYRIGWKRGTTEGGSSGSALFVRDQATGTRYLAGVLHGGNASCSNQGGFDAYGRFDGFFPAVQPWLQP